MAKQKLPGYPLSQEDRDALRDLWDEWNRRQRGAENRPGADLEEQPAPEVYVAVAPDDGIPALSGTTPGSAYCTVYTLWEDADGNVALTEVSEVEQKVYNLATSAVSAGAYVVVLKDKYGNWFTTPSSSSLFLVRCTGRGLDNKFPGVITTYDALTNAYTDTGLGVILLSAANGPVLQGRRYQCSYGGLQSDGELILIVIQDTHTALGQLVVKSYSDNCPVYKALRVSGGAACIPGEYLQGPCLDPVYNIRGADHPVCAPPSPQRATPALCVSDNTAGGEEWQYPNRVRGDEDVRAYCDLTLGTTTQRLYPSEFCFLIPEYVNGAVPGFTGTGSATTGNGVTVTNIEVQVTARATGGTGVRASEVKLVIGGLVGGNSQHTSAQLTDSDTVFSYSNTPDGWGVPNSPSYYNDSTFGVSLRYEYAATGTGTAPDDTLERRVEVDEVRVILEFYPYGTYEPLATFKLELSDDGTYWTFDSPPHWDLTEDVDGADPSVIDGVSYRPAHTVVWDQDLKTLVQKRESYNIGFG